jgi:uncharacterized protein
MIIRRSVFYYCLDRGITESYSGSEEMRDGSLSIVTRKLVFAVQKRFLLDLSGIHGAPHWARVRVNGLAIASMNGARTDVIQLFSFLHDSCRDNEGFDPDHGRRAVDFARSLRGSVFDIDNSGFDLLVQACADHSKDGLVGDITVQTCWDADRLDLWRVGIETDPRRLATEAARNPSIFEGARRRSLAGSSR